MDQTFNQIYNLMGNYLPYLIGAIVILIVGWLVAWLVSSTIRGIIRKTSIDKKIASWSTEEKADMKVDLSKWTGKLVFWVIMLFVLIAFFQTLQLTLVTEPLNKLLSQIFEFAPQIVGALILILIAWIIATVIRVIIIKTLSASKINQKLSSKIGVEEGQVGSIAKPIGDTAYWLIFLLFLPAILSSLKLDGLLSPVQSLLNEILSYLPNILSAVVILVVGWFVARVVSRLVTNLLSAIGADKLGEKIGFENLTKEKRLSSVLGTVVFILILLPIVVAALNALQIDAVTKPASDMLNQILQALPAIFVAALLLIVSYFVGKLLSSFVGTLLSSLGFNKFFKKLGFTNISEDTSYSPSNVAGYLVLVSIMLFAFAEAFAVLKFNVLSNLVNQFILFGSQILLGLVILGFGLFLANLAFEAIKSSRAKQSSFLAMVARISIVVLAVAMALRQMGLANEIIIIAFGLTLGAIAIAVAVAFGIGGRDLAAKKLAEWNETLSK
jgi:hypothetical protein